MHFSPSFFKGFLPILAFGDFFSVFRTYWPNFRRDLSLTVRVLVLGSFIFLLCVTIGVGSIYYPFSMCLRVRHEVLHVRIEPLKAWHDVINLEFIIYLVMFQFHSYLSLFHVLYFMSILTNIFCIICDLGALGVAKKI